MGVVHKLKQEVIDFIVQQKTADIDLSVRKLSELASQQFQTKISKSSISNILKDTNLSSSVGRRGKVMGKKAIIPAEKKEQLFKEAKPAFEPQKKEIPKDKIKEELEKLSKPLKESLPEKPQEPEKDIIQKDKPEQVSLMPDPVSQIEEKEIKANPQEEPLPVLPEAKPASAPSVKPALREGAGMIFLKAAQWETSGRVALGSLFRKNISAKLPANFDAICDALVGLNLLNVVSKDDLRDYDNHALWYLNGFQRAPDISLVKNWAEGMEYNKKLSLDFMNFRNQSFIDINAFQLDLEDGSYIYIDGSFISLWKDRPIVSFSSPVYKAMGRLSGDLITNTSTLMLFSSKMSIFSQGFRKFVCALENIPGQRIVGVRALGMDSREMALFTTIPNKRRFFALGLFPQKEDFQEMVKTIKWAKKEEVLFKPLNKIYYFSESRTAAFSQNISEQLPDYRVLTVWAHKSEELAMAILTNDLSRDASSIVLDFVSRWPDIHNSNVMSLLDEDGNIEYLKDLQDKGSPAPECLEQGPQWGSFSEIIDEYGRSIHAFCKNNYYKSYYNITPQEAATEIYNLPGRIEETEDGIHVMFEVDTTYDRLKDLGHAVKNINERAIISPDGKRLVLSVQN